MTNIDFDKVAEYVNKNYPDIVAKKIKIADDVMNNTFLFDMPNDLERTTESVHFDGDIDWEYVLNGDKEFAYQLARHRYFVDLGEAYRLTSDEKYAKRIVDICTDFIKRVPYKKNSLAWRTLETGLRCEYWTRALALIRDSSCVTDSFLKLFRKSLDKHARVLIDEKIPHHRLSNWGVLQDHGLFDIALELNNSEYRNIALGRLYDEANLQVMADGVHWEVSTTYHNEVLQCFMDTVLRAKQYGVELDTKFLGIVKQMALVDVYWIKPNHNGPLYGDSDVTDLRGILSVASYLFGDGLMKYVAGNVFDYETTWRIGMDEVAEYENIKAKAPTFNSYSLSDSGNYIMRTDYSEKANYLIFHNSNTGGGHAHEDKLSFELSVSGQDILVDTGRFSYVWNEDRQILKSFAAHNTTSVDDKHFVKPNGWDYIGPIAPSIREEMIVSDEYELVKGTHAGYANKGITTRRSILWIKPDIYIIIDEFFGKGGHKFNSYFNFAPGSRCNMLNNSINIENNGVKCYLQGMDSKAVWTEEVGRYSDHYNAIESIFRAKCQIKGKNNAHIVNVFVGNSDKYPDLRIERVSVKDAYGKVMKDADAVKITANGVKYTLIMQFKEHIKLLMADDKPATGKFTLYKNDEYNIIKW